MKKLLSLLVLVSSFAFASSEPNLSAMKGAGNIIHSEVKGEKSSRGWEVTNLYMKELKVFDEAVNRMMEVICSEETNKSVLIVGEANDTYKYVFSRLAMMDPIGACKKYSHAEIIASKLQGYMYVGTTEKKWQDHVQNAAYNKDVVVYFNNIAQLIGVGTSSNRETGIEATYVEALISGKLKSVAFINKYDYNRLSRSRHAYVLNAFQETVKLKTMSASDMDQMARHYFDTFKPGMKYTDKVMNYLYRTVNYYQPNIDEPQRTLDIVKSIISSKDSKIKVENPSVIQVLGSEYKGYMKKDFDIIFPNANSMSLTFEQFHTEKPYDYLIVFDPQSKKALDTFSGNLGSFTTKLYKTNHVVLKFRTNKNVSKEGFKISHITTHETRQEDLSYEMIRKAIMKVVQIPEWMMTRNYTVVRDLKGKLDGDVVGVKDGKKDVLKQIKIGYVSGRTDEKPAGALMFVGPTGTGKSYIPKKTAEFMGMPLVTMDMTQYGTVDTFDRFVETLSNYLVLYPYAFYLFEEIDKANVKVLDRLYFMLDEGIFYDLNQRPLFARGSFIMMTTNTGHDLIIREQNNPKLRELVNLELQKTYRPSFLNRFDAISIFMPFSDDEYMQLAKIMTSKKVKKMDEFFDWKVNISQDVIRFMGLNGRSKLYGARPMERTIENVISLGISEYQIMVGTIDFGSQVRIEKVGGLYSNKFEITVNNGTPLEYEVSVGNNNGTLSLKSIIVDPKLKNFFESIRMY